MAKGIKFHTYLIEKHLNDSERAAGYLKEALIEGDLELLRTVAGDLIDASYEGFKVTVNKSDINGAQDSIDVEMIQQALEVKS